MLKGFTTEALVIFPLYEDYDGRGYGYKNKLKKSVNILTDYLHESGIVVDYFSSDDVAHEGIQSPDRWAITLNRGDMFFVQNNCDGGEVLSDNIVNFEDVYQDTASRYPIDRSMSVERRFEVTLKRDAMARRIIARKYKLVFLFKQPKSPALKYTVKKDSGVLYTEINNSTFEVKCWMSDMEIDPVNIFGVKNAFMPLYEWEVEHGTNVQGDGRI